MIQLDPSRNEYLLNITYQGKSRTYRLKPYHTDGRVTSYMLFASNRVLDFEFDGSRGKLTQILLHGEAPAPEEFRALIEAEVASLGG